MLLTMIVFSQQLQHVLHIAVICSLVFTFIDSQSETSSLLSVPKT